MIALTPDAAALWVGEKIGSGVDRTTYHCLNPAFVLKLCTGQYDYQNVAEWLLWTGAGEELRHWLAPAWTISPAGSALLAKYCEPCPTHLIPAKVPRVISEDAHPENWGLFEGRPVLLDYGRNLATKLGSTGKANMKLVNRAQAPSS